MAVCNIYKHKCIYLFLLIPLFYSGFVESKNVKDFVQNRSTYINLGKGVDFKKAVADIDAQLNGTHVI